ncbi:cytochrome D ubiquinol oxidase subunit I [Lichenicola cladoniae]|uniref:Cytochrome D ubiquinol oxidase subunit I n=1 Tax=Lichenicola cladoniae TaxID=1484109 RepID=A0A6M8HQZ6_9PROT|nr:pyridoxal-dependent decarboxylase [Lichenicola cladoniae]NPD68809.1 cytochrome D ubiquinol oxidase subunit I [Acetobacteraceae bacterium]QKE90772.1 cytochrome D ubiquinol oxidase subunit I [Lichenicola cladoniae]
MAGLDPEDWGSLRALGHRMLDDMIDRLATQSSDADPADNPVWQPMPASERQALRRPLPRGPSDPAELYEQFQQRIVPYALGNTHPRFMGWVHGGGTGIGMLAEMLAAGLNANLGGRDHAPIELERTVIRWAAEMVGMPDTSSGLLVTGSSMANMIAVLTARRAWAGPTVRSGGVGSLGLVGYAGSSAHGCIPRAFDMAGLGTEALRAVPVDPNHRMSLPALEAAIARDRAAGLHPFIVVATAGSVDTGAIDDLDAIATLCARERIWFHVDGAFGALAALSPTLRQHLAGIERADSLAFDFHKWAQVPYDAGCVVVRDAGAQADAFAQTLAYLGREDRGAAGNAPWPCDLGPDLSRGFRALKVWMTLGTYGADRMGEMVDQCCAVARHLAARIEAEPDLELLAPVGLNIVCFRFCRGADDLDQFNAELVKDLHESGIAVPSTTTIGGVRAIRAAIVNHRTQNHDADIMIDGLLALAALRHSR